MGFGDQLRKWMADKGVSMGQVARHLGVTVPYVADVIHNRRGAFSEDRIKLLAPFLGIEEAIVLKAAEESRRFVRVDTEPVAPQNKDVAYAFARRFSSLSEEQVKRMRAILEEKPK